MSGRKYGKVTVTGWIATWVSSSGNVGLTVSSTKDGGNEARVDASLASATEVEYEPRPFKDGDVVAFRDDSNPLMRMGGKWTGWKRGSDLSDENVRAYVASSVAYLVDINAEVKS